MRYGGIIGLPVFLGCEEDVTAVLDPEHPFEIYGVLNSLTDTPFVRVFSIEATLNPSPGMPVGTERALRQ